MVCILRLVVTALVLLTTENLPAVEPESGLYSDKPGERETIYRLKEEELRINMASVVDEKEAQQLKLQLQLLRRLRDLLSSPDKPAVDLDFPKLDLQHTISWQDTEKYLERYVDIVRESRLSKQNIKNTKRHIQELYDQLIALDERSSDQDLLQLQYAYQVGKLNNLQEIDTQLQQGLEKAKERYPQILERTSVDPVLITRQLGLVDLEKDNVQKLEDKTTLAMAEDEALIQQQEGLLAEYLGRDLGDNESRVMHYEQLKLLDHQVTKLAREDKRIESEVVYFEVNMQALWLQLLAKNTKYFEISDGLRDMMGALESLLEKSKKVHYQLYSREKELSALRGGNALIGPKAQELVSKLEGFLRDSLTRLSNFDQRLSVLSEKGTILQRTVDQRQSSLGAIVTKTREATDDIFEKIMSVLRFPLVSYSGMSISLLLLIEIVLLLFVGIIVNRLYGLLIARMGGKRNWSERTIHLVQAVGKYPFIFIVAMIILSVVGINTSSLALVAGALSVGIGFGMQTIVNNLVSGIILLFDKSIRPGDYISLGGDTLTGGYRGNVMQMNIRATVLRTNDNISIIIPNADLMASQVVNWTYADEKIRFRVPFSVAYGTDIDDVKEIVGKAVVALSVVLAHPEPQIWLAKHGESSLDFLAAIWVEGENARRPSRTFDTVLSAIYKTLNSHGIEIPFPQLNLRVQKQEHPQAKVYDYTHLPN